MPLIDMPDFAATLLDEFSARATTRVDTPVIQPAAPFLDMAGEDLRRRIFLTENERGESLCLRPEFTIPVCLRHIETATGTPKRYAYLGEVFRQRREGAQEFYQAGIEDLGNTGVAAADARAVADSVQILTRLLPGKRLSVMLGDQSVFEAVVQALGLPAGWQKRLIQAFGNPAQIDQLLRRLATPSPVPGLAAEVSDLLSKGNEAALVAHIDETMQATGYLTNASRTPVEIPPAEGKAGAGRNPPRRRGFAAAARIPLARAAAGGSLRRTGRLRRCRRPEAGRCRLALR